MTQTCGSTPMAVADLTNLHSNLLLKFKMTQTYGFTPAVVIHFGNLHSNLMVIQTVHITDKTFICYVYCAF